MWQGFESRPTHIKYGTGDEIWLAYDGDTPRVIKIKTHDGIEWEETLPLQQPHSGGDG